MKRVRYHPAARAELRGAALHDEAEQPGRGVDLEGAVQYVLTRLQILPRSAPPWPSLDELPFEIRRAKVRHHPYIVVYANLPDQLVVIAVAHTRKRPGYWRDRLG